MALYKMCHELKVAKAPVRRDNVDVLEFTGIVSTASEDRDGEVIELSAWKRDLKNYLDNPVVLFQHRCEMVIGRAPGIELTEKALTITEGEIVVAPFTEQLIIPAMMSGSLKAMSVGFDPIESEDMDPNADPNAWWTPQRYTRVELLENSVVAIGSNRDAGVQSVAEVMRAYLSGMDPGARPVAFPNVPWPVGFTRGQQQAVVRQLVEDGTLPAKASVATAHYTVTDSDGQTVLEGNAEIPAAEPVKQAPMLPLADESYPWDAKAALKRVRAYASSDGTGADETIDVARYARAFASPGDSIEGCALPIADVVEGTLRAVLPACQAALEVLYGAKGKLDVAEAEMPNVRATLLRYWQAYGMEDAVEDVDAPDLMTLAAAGYRGVKATSDGPVFDADAARLSMARCFSAREPHTQMQRRSAHEALCRMYGRLELKAPTAVEGEPVPGKTPWAELTFHEGEERIHAAWTLRAACASTTSGARHLGKIDWRPDEADRAALAECRDALTELIDKALDEDETDDSPEDRGTDLDEAFAAKLRELGIDPEAPDVQSQIANKTAELLKQLTGDDHADDDGTAPVDPGGAGA